MEYGKSPFQVTIKWREIGRAALELVWETVYTHVTPNPNGYRGDHFTHEDPENVGYEAIRTSEEQEEVLVGYDKHGFPQYADDTRLITREDHPEIFEQIEMYFSIPRGGWDSEGCYYEGDR